MSLLEDLGQRQIARTLFRAMHRERYLRAKSRTIKEADVGEDWPLAVPEIELFWVADAIFIRANGTLYWVNGWAEAFLRGIGEEVRDIREIQRPNLDFPGALKTTTPLFDLARELKYEEKAPMFSQWWWRQWGLRLIKILFAPLIFISGILEFTLKGLTAIIRLRGGGVITIFGFLILLALSGLTTGLLIQEIYGAIIKLYREPFSDHAIFYGIGLAIAFFAIPVYLIKHHDQDDRR